MQGVGVGFSGEESGGGSMSTVSREENLVWSSEDSSYPDESELDLGLGLSLGGGGFKSQKASRPGQYGRILTAKDLPSSSPSSASSSSSPSLSRANGTAGVKRTSDSAANGSSQVVGWPPVRAQRVNSMANQAKTVATEGFSQTFNKIESKNTEAEKQNISCHKDSGNAKRCSLFVKVNMDGTPIGRKVDLNSHGCYETLAKALEAMFLSSTTSMDTRRSGEHKNGIVVDATTSPKLLNGLAEFVLTYEDKDGDWMLVGDVPWGMFISSVKRLRIMRTSEATGLAPRLQGSERKQNKLI